MYLDKPLRDHTLLQAICRTNRTYGDKKTHGLIVDYLGVFDDVAKALEFDEKGFRSVVGNIEGLKDQMPEAMQKCLAFFPGIDRAQTGCEGLMAVQECLPNNDVRDAFAAEYSVLGKLWEAISPDPMLLPFEVDYRWLTQVYVSVQPTSGTGKRLVVFDYFLVHSDDIEGGPEGLHPQTPHRGGGILVRRGVLQEGLTLYESRGLVERVYKDGGIFFAATDKSADFLDTLSTEYLRGLRERADWVVDSFGLLDREARPAPADVAQACKAEAAKTFKLLQDLQTTRAATAAEIEQLQGTRDTRQGELNTISAELKALMDQHVDVAAKKVDDLRARAETCRKAIELLERLQELDELLEQANKPKKKEKTGVAGAAVSTAQADPFSREVQALLKGWHFPDLDRVSFSENDQDVVISGRARKSHGKGVRAITRAAFNLALLRLCVEDERPFPNFVLIDSPLLVYEEPEADESSFPQDIKKHLWESVKTSFAETQVIIIENSHQLPGDGTLSDVNVVLFTGNDQGRRGFIPQPAGVA